MKSEFTAKLQAVGIDLNDAAHVRFETYYTALIEWNEKMNLTAITDKNEVFMKHFFDSIMVVNAVNLEGCTLLDVGSGAGFPGVPLNIIFPTMKLTVIDAQKKRLTFLEHLSEQIELPISLVHERAETFQSGEGYDVVTARAVAPLNILAELCLPHVKHRGVFIAMKGKEADNELEIASKAIETLGGSVERVIEYDVLGMTRKLLVIRKVKKTPLGYPRPYHKIKKRPL